MANASARVEAAVRRRVGRPDEGELWLCFLTAAGDVVLCTRVAEGTDHVDELFLRDLADHTRAVGTPVVVLAVIRASRQATRRDRLLWREMKRRLAGSMPTRVELLVLGTGSA
jgi:hypothetical protein